MNRENKKKAKSLLDVLIVGIIVLSLVFIGVFVVAKNASTSNVSAKESTVEKTNKVSEATNSTTTREKVEIKDNLERVGVCGFEDFIYYRDKITDVMYICFYGYNRGGMVEMTDPNTGLPLTYENYLKYQEGSK